MPARHHLQQAALHLFVLTGAQQAAVKGQIQALLSGANNSGVGGDQGGGGGSASGNPVTPNDGAGSRSRVRPISTDIWRARLGI